MKKPYLRICMVIFTAVIILSFSDVKTYAISQSDVQNKLQSYMNRYVGKTATSGQLYMGAQCKGFANWIFKEIFGVYIGPYPESANYKITNPNAKVIGILEPGNLTENSAKNLLKKGAPGDYIQVQRSTARGRGPHSMILISVNNSGIEVFDCNSDGRNTIKRYAISYHDFDVANRAMSLYRANGYSPLAQGAPTNPTIAKNQIWYDLKDRIEITAHADGATEYYMSMFKDDKRIFAQGVNGGKFMLDASAYGTGHYTACFSCCNSAGSIDTGWIDFSVVGPAGYSDVRVSNWWYDLTDTVCISVDTICAKYQFVGIDKEGVGRVVTECTGSTYKIAASRLGVGRFSCYFSVANGSGSVDTRRVSFEIVDKPKAGAVVSASKKSYTLKDNVELSVLVYCSKSQWIGIDRNGTERALTAQVFDGKYTIPASRLGRGKYSFYFTVQNSSGWYDTSRVEFSIDQELANAAISMNKTEYMLDETIKIRASADGGVNDYTALIYDSKGKKVVNKDFTGHTFSLNASGLGEGTYMAKVICSNYAFSIATKTIRFTVSSRQEDSAGIVVSPEGSGRKPVDESLEENLPPLRERDAEEASDEDVDGDSAGKTEAEEDNTAESPEPSRGVQGNTLTDADRPDKEEANKKTAVKSPVIKALKKARKAIKVTWKKVKGVTGYQIEYSASRKFKKVGRITVGNGKTTTKTIRKLKSRKRYYIRIRAYRTVNGEKRYSKWSKVKNQRVK